MTELDLIEAQLKGANVPVERLKVRENQVFSLAARALLAACNKHPNHPHAKIFRSVVEHIPPDEEVHVDRVDLEALLRNKTVELEIDQSIQFVEGQNKLVTTQRKVLKGDSNEKTDGVASPAAAVADPDA